MKTLISNGTVVTPSGAARADLLTDGERILGVGVGIAPEDKDGILTIDATGKIVLPGGVDAHTHITLNLDESLGGEVFYSGTLPAAAGGTTSIVDHLAFAPEGRPIARQLALYKELAQGRSAVDYSFHGLIQSDEENALDELPLLQAEGVSSVKAYMTYAHRLEDAALLRFLQRCKELGMLAAIHAEGHACVEMGRARCIAEGKLDPIWHARSRPPLCEAEAVRRLLRLAGDAGDAPVYIVHLSTALALREVQKARDAGQKNIFVETCPQYLCLTEDRYRNPETGLRCLMSPPLREHEDNEALWEGLRRGDVQTVATDHCSFTIAQKERGRGDFTRCPGGAPGLEERFILMFSEGVSKGRLSLERFAEVVSADPAKLMGLYPRKGALLPGSDADVVIVDPDARHALSHSTLHGPGDYSIYEGLELQGKIESVLLRGRPVFQNQALSGGLRGAGVFLARQGRSGLSQ